MPNTDDFRAALMRRFAEGLELKARAIDVNSGELHRRLGDYPGTDHRMPVCCDVMLAEMRAGDEIVTAPPKKHGANLTIRYRLPR